MNTGMLCVMAVFGLLTYMIGVFSGVKIQEQINDNDLMSAKANANYLARQRHNRYVGIGRRRRRRV